MLRFRLRLSAAAASLVVLGSLLISVTAASAASITVDLRVEGATTTLFEGPITTSPETLETASSQGPHPCNYSSNGSSESTFADGGTPSGTPTTALHDATLAAGLAFDAEWFGNEIHGGEPGDFFVTRVGPDANGGPPSFPSWGYAVNDTTANVGGCQIQLAPGNEVLWAYNYFNLSHLLALSGPTSVNAGTPFTVHVADGRTGEPIAGASLGTLAGGVTTPLASAPPTDASGNAAIVIQTAGSVTLKAAQPESVRSNGLGVCVHAGADGTCGSSSLRPGGPDLPPSTGIPPSVARSLIVRALGVTSGHVYSRRAAPRVLRGAVTVGSAGTLRQVRIRLQRRVGHGCFDFIGRSVRFVRVRRCRPAAFFSVGSSESFSYLLPARLAPGRYVYDVDAIEASGHSTSLVAGVSHVIFRVR
jgi:hypothetical protein